MAVKMMLVPATTPSAPLTSMEGMREDYEKKSAGGIEREMKEVIESDHIPDDRKLKMYHDLMGRMLRYMDISRSKGLPVSIQSSQTSKPLPVKIQPPEEKPTPIASYMPTPDMSTLLEELPHSSHPRARRLLKHLSQHMSWDENNKELVYKGHRTPYNRARELIRDVVTSRKPISQSEHLTDFLHALEETGAPKSVLATKKLKSDFMRHRVGRERGEWRPY